MFPISMNETHFTLRWKNLNEIHATFFSTKCFSGIEYFFTIYIKSCYISQTLLVWYVPMFDVPMEDNIFLCDATAKGSFML